MIMSAQDGTFPGQLSGIFRNKMAAKDPSLDSSWDFKFPLNLEQKVNAKFGWDLAEFVDEIQPSSWMRSSGACGWNLAELVDEI